MSVISSDPGGGSGYFSPDKSRFAVVLHKGNLARDTTDYSLLIYRYRNDLKPVEESTVHLSSSIDVAAMSNVRWLNDDTIAFVGIDGDSAPHAYTFDVHKKKLEKWPTPPGFGVFAFDSTPNHSVVAEILHQTKSNCSSTGSQAAVILITTQQLTDLLSDTCPAANELFLGRFKATPTEVLLRDTAILGNVSLSPDGRYAVVMEPIPADSDERKRFHIPSDYSVLRYLLVDTQTRTIRPLIDAPALPSRSPEPVWSRDGRYAIVTNTCLPGMATAASSETAMPLFTTEIDVKTGELAKISNGMADLLKWDSEARMLLLQPRQMGGSSGAPATYRKQSGMWEEVATESQSGAELPVVEDMNTPPRLYISYAGSKEKALVLDPNPQFKSLRFGTVKQIEWDGSDGRKTEGGLYLPPGFTEAKKYPLVIQLEGWDPSRFWIDGPSTAGYAAQVLACRGFIVAQLPLPARDTLTSTKEGPTAVSAIEGLIDHLDQQGVIDRHRIGLLGWSRTGFHVRYFLEFSQYQIAAAVIADGMDASYFQYLGWVNTGGAAGYTYEQINGGVPFGAGLESWLKNATGFNLTKVHTPVLLLGFRQYSLLNNWEWFTGLSQLHKPVEFIWLPSAIHSPQKPSERITAQGGTVDWFSFWLQGAEDSDPNKATQYARWDKLRELQAAGMKTIP